ncbi:MAG: glycosyltransferase family 4 protein [Polyangiaceae bacterium]
MRLLHVSDRLSARGGADWHLLGVLAELARRGHEVLLAVGRRDLDAASHAPAQVEVVPGLDAASGAEPARDALEGLRRRWSPDLVHVHNALAPEVLAWAADVGAIATVQDHRSFCPGRGKITLEGAVCDSPMAPELCAACFDDAGYHARIQAVTEARLAALRRMRRITVLSRYMQRELAAVGVTAVDVVPPFVHGIDPQATPSGPPCVLFAGRLVAAKGASDAVQAWRRSGVALPLLLAGSGRERAALEGLGAEVLGWVDHRVMSGVYRRARALVLPSRWQEPFGIVGLEALACGVPVAAWSSGGVAEWHPGAPALVPWGDVEGLAGAIAEAVAGPRASLPDTFATEPLMAALLASYGRAVGGDLTSPAEL